MKPKHVAGLTLAGAAIAATPGATGAMNAVDIILYPPGLRAVGSIDGPVGRSTGGEIVLFRRLCRRRSRRRRRRCLDINREKKLVTLASTDDDDRFQARRNQAHGFFAP